MTLDFEADSSEYCDGAVTGITGDTVGTIAVWAKPEGTTECDFFFVGDKDVTNSYLDFQLRETNKLACRVYDAGSPQSYQMSDAQASGAGELHHFAVVQNGASAVLYVDGSAVDSSPRLGENDAGAWMDDVPDIDTLAVGGARDSTPDRYFDGIIYDVAYWNTNLSAAQVALLYAAGEPLRYQPTLVLPGNLKRYWPMDEGTATTAADQSGQGYDLTLQTAPEWVANHRYFSADLYAQGAI